LISDDSAFAERLNRAAKANELIIAQTGDLDDALRQLKARQPIAVLLDLDLADNMAWVIADQLLQEEDCPQLVLLTARMGHFDLEAASRAGSVMDKTAEAAWLGLLSELLEEPGPAQAARNAVQRVLIRWLRPCEWPIQAARAQRWWGINE
jgi:CheY-like chemotaxis protein